ncbi:MAG: acyl-CoA dehydratase activase [Candidatus Helarchaeota archaeon]
MNYIGIDVGTSFAKCLILDENKKIKLTLLKRVEGNPKKAVQEILKEAIKKASISKKKIKFTIGTGCNMKSVMKKKQTNINKEVPEITCIAKGVHELLPSARTIVDVGALSNKAIRLNEKGAVLDYSLNERCASGSGFFLETAMKALELTYDEMSSRPFEVDKDKEITITSQCSIFGESEVIYLKNENYDPIAIAAGINNSIAGRMLSIVKRIGVVPDIVVTGGVAHNIHLLKKFEERLDGIKLKKVDKPQFVGALGAAIFAIEENI